MLNSETSKNFSLFILAIAFVAFTYGTVKAIERVNKTQVSTTAGIYTSYVSTSKEIEQKAYALTHNCRTEMCMVQNLLDFSSTIPYKTKFYQQNSPQKTIQENYGDCDDKSNLLISMLHAVDIEAYFVLVPRHIFVIVPLDDMRLLEKKGLWVNNKKYYILESTAKESKIGFSLHYRLDEIDIIVDPFTNEKIQINSLEYKL